MLRINDSTHPQIDRLPVFNSPAAIAVVSATYVPCR